jgi:hypothetical protein
MAQLDKMKLMGLRVKIDHPSVTAVKLVTNPKPHMPTLNPPKTQKTTRTVCNHPQANLLKNISKAKITKNTNPTNSLHI